MLYVYSTFYCDYVCCCQYCILVVFFLMIRRPPRSTLDRSSAASDVYKRQTRFNGNFATTFTAGKEIKTGPGFKNRIVGVNIKTIYACLLYTSPSPRDRTRSRMPSSAWKKKKKKYIKYTHANHYHSKPILQNQHITTVKVI